MKSLRRSPLVLLAFLIGASGVSAANFTFNNGDIILGFQASGGDGSTKNVFFNLGAGTAHRDNGNLGNLGNISASLSAAFGNNWFSRTDIHFGAIGNLNFAPNTGIGSMGAVNGDPSRTFYVSRAAATSGSSLPWTGYNTNPLGTAGSTLAGMEAAIQTLAAESDGAAILDKDLNGTAWANGWSTYNPVPGSAFTIFNGGIQQTLGGGGNSARIDIQRILPTNTGANPTGTVGTGSYETTIIIGSDGSITAQNSSSPATPFETWSANYPSLDTAEKRLPTADPDNDGVKNLAEFAYGGNPASGSSNGIRQTLTQDANNDSQRDLTLTVEVRSGAVFSASSNDMVATIDGVTYRIEGSTDLVNFDSQIVEVIPHLGTGSPSSGYVFKTFRLVSSSGLSGKGFIRASAE